MNADKDQPDITESSVTASQATDPMSPISQLLALELSTENSQLTENTGSGRDNRTDENSVTADSSNTGMLDFTKNLQTTVDLLNAGQKQLAAHLAVAAVISMSERSKDDPSWFDNSVKSIEDAVRKSQGEQGVRAFQKAALFIQQTQQRHAAQELEQRTAEIEELSTINPDLD